MTMIVGRQNLCTSTELLPPLVHGPIAMGASGSSYAVRCQLTRQKQRLRAQAILRNGDKEICASCWAQDSLVLRQKTRRGRLIATILLSVGLHMTVVVGALLVRNRFSNSPAELTKPTPRLVIMEPNPPIPAALFAHEQSPASSLPAEVPPSVAPKTASRTQSPRPQKHSAVVKPPPSAPVQSLDNFSLSNDNGEHGLEKSQTSSQVGTINQSGSAESGKGQQVGEIEKGKANQSHGSGEGFTQARPKGGRIKPNYPAALERRGITGEVNLSVYVSETGEVKQVKVIQSAGYPEFDRAAVEAARREQWLPAQKNGQVVATWRSFRVTFGF